MALEQLCRRRRPGRQRGADRRRRAGRAARGGRRAPPAERHAPAADAPSRGPRRARRRLSPPRHAPAPGAPSRRPCRPRRRLSPPLRHARPRAPAARPSRSAAWRFQDCHPSNRTATRNVSRLLHRFRVSLGPSRCWSNYSDALETLIWVFRSCAPADQTNDLRIRSPCSIQLSYRGGPTKRSHSANRSDTSPQRRERTCAVRDRWGRAPRRARGRHPGRHRRPARPGRLRRARPASRSVNATLNGGVGNDTLNGDAGDDVLGRLRGTHGLAVLVTDAGTVRHTVKLR